ncbi:capZ-interacting protein [Protobothrops mucrosquamatus]|uniref:capZ-interacting protein n=1 Tax=Protobothrops mucrosquamatus TaxID=103944 RepID=UPI0007757601|nr:capZ-interacting protein [Protobothrops mucrosquamatus]
MGEEILPKTIPHLHNREDKPSETKMMVEKPTTPSVAQLAGKFQEQSSVSGKEIPAPKPVRRKPPCSLPLHTNKMELGQNGELKPSSNASRPIRIRPKSSPLIEKMQANLAFVPTSMLPGASPKSPGLKAMMSPFNSAPVTPVSPHTHSSSPDECPVSFDQPPEGTHLQFYNKVRTRGSIKRRPPSRRFRKSQSEYGDDLDLEGTVLPQENGSKAEEKEDVGVFMDKNKTMKSSPAPVDGIDHHKKKNHQVSDEKSSSDLQSSGLENKEKEVDTEKVTKFKESQEDKTHQNLSEEKPNTTVNIEKEKNADTDTAEDTKRTPWNCIASDLENTYKEKREGKINESEDSHHESSIQDTGTSQPDSDMKLF